MWKNDNFAVTFVKSTISPPAISFFCKNFVKSTFLQKNVGCYDAEFFFRENTKKNLLIWHMVSSCKALEALAVSRKKTHFRKNWDCKKRYFHTMALW